MKWMCLILAGTFFAGINHLKAQGQIITKWIDSLIYSEGTPDGTAWNPLDKVVYVSVNADGQPTEIHFYTFVSGQWELSGRELTTYNSSGKVAERVEELWDATANQWIPSRRDLYAYLSDSVTILEELRQTWDNTAQQWVNSSRKTWGYTANTVEINNQTWNNATNSWENSSRAILTFNADRLVTEHKGQIWNTTTSSWDNNYRYLYTYDANGNRTEYVYQLWDAGGAVWENIFRTLYIYDPSTQLLITEIAQDWNNTTSTWENSARRQYEYIDGKLTYQLRELWNTTSALWENFKQYFYSYDPNGNLITTMIQDWNTTSNTWENNRLTQMQYNTANKETYVLDMRWNTSSNRWENSRAVHKEYIYDTILVDEKEYFWSLADDVWKTDQRTQYFYTVPTATGINKLAEEQFISFVVDRTLYVSIDGNYALGDLLVNLMDVSGRTIFSAPMQSNLLQVNLLEYPKYPLLLVIYDNASGERLFVKKIFF